MIDLTITWFVLLCLCHRGKLLALQLIASLKTMTRGELSEENSERIAASVRPRAASLFRCGALLGAPHLGEPLKSGVVIIASTSLFW